MYQIYSYNFQASTKVKTTPFYIDQKKFYRHFQVWVNNIRYEGCSTSFPALLKIRTAAGTRLRLFSVFVLISWAMYDTKELTQQQFCDHTRKNNHDNWGCVIEFLCVFFLLSRTLRRYNNKGNGRFVNKINYRT